jgi:hypothetical protein
MTDDMAISDLTLERFRLDELPAAEASRVTARVARDPDLRRRLAALSRSDDAFRDLDLIGQLTRSVVGRTSGVAPLTPRPGLRPWQWAAMACASAAIVTAMAWSPGLRQGAVDTSPVARSEGPDRVKGDAPSLMLYRKDDSGSQLLSDGAPVRRGDLIRVAYRAAGPCFGVIVSIDGAGVVTRHLPVDASAAAPMQPGEARPLDTSYELDDAPKWEQFFLVTGERAFDVRTVLDAARRAGAGAGGGPPAVLPLPSDLHQSSFLLRKVF